MVGLVGCLVLLTFSILISWFMDFLANASPDKSRATPARQITPSEVSIWKWLALGSASGILVGLFSYLQQSAYAHHWITGYPALQMVLGRFLGASIFGTVGALILARRLHAKSIGLVFVYFWCMLSVGPFFVEMVMRSLGLPTTHTIF
jgi:hypothetical protein